MSENLDNKKAQPTIDEVIDRRMQTILDLINEHMSKVYKDFNTAMINQTQNVKQVEKDLSKAIEVLWGIVNKSNARAAGLEALLIKNGLSPDNLAEEVLTVEKAMKESGNWIELPLDEALVEKDETPPPPPKNPAQKL